MTTNGKVPTQVNSGDRVTSGTGGLRSKPSHRPVASDTTRDTSPQVDGAPWRCVAFKQNNRRCSNEAKEGGLCRFHLANAVKDAKAGRPIDRTTKRVKINQDTGEKQGANAPAAWTCIQCGEGAEGTVEERESTNTHPMIGRAHDPGSTMCSLCHTVVVHWELVAVVNAGGLAMLIRDCQRLPVHVDNDHPHADRSPCFWAPGRDYRKVCHRDWEPSCHQRSHRTFGFLN